MPNLWLCVWGGILCVRVCACSFIHTRRIGTRVFKATQCLLLWKTTAMAGFFSFSEWFPSKGEWFLLHLTTESEVFVPKLFLLCWVDSLKTISTKQCCMFQSAYLFFICLPSLTSILPNTETHSNIKHVCQIHTGEETFTQTFRHVSAQLGFQNHATYILHYISQSSLI